MRTGQHACTHTHTHTPGGDVCRLGAISDPTGGKNIMVMPFSLVYTYIPEVAIEAKILLPKDL